MLLKISDGNSKLGKIPNFSKTPIRGCSANCRHCARDCYALKAYRAYPAVKAAWDNNHMAMVAENTPELYEEISDYLSRKAPRMFRIHVSGDFRSQWEFDFWSMVANDFPETKFLAFTKNDAIDYSESEKPENLQVIASMWPGMEDKFPANIRRSWVQDGTENRIPSDAIECPGHCDDCGMCWSLSNIGRDVYFIIH